MRNRTVLIIAVSTTMAVAIACIAVWALRIATSPVLELVPPAEERSEREPQTYQGKFKRTGLSHGQVFGGGRSVGSTYTASDGARAWGFSATFGSPSGAAKELDR